MDKYYKAYNQRYQQVHDEGLLWFSSNPTPEVMAWIKHNKISKLDNICEIGCGEGRDTMNLAGLGYKLVGADISDIAINKCKELSKSREIKVDWKVLDATKLKETKLEKYQWIYSVATLHMLVEDEDRKAFLKSLYDQLKPGGKCLIVSMGDGVNERKTDISQAFELQERTHMTTGRSFELAGTSYRAVNWENHKKELLETGFIIEETLNTENDDYFKCMTVYLSKK